MSLVQRMARAAGRANVKAAAHALRPTASSAATVHALLRGVPETFVERHLRSDRFVAAELLATAESTRLRELVASCQSLDAAAAALDAPFVPTPPPYERSFARWKLPHVAAGNLSTSVGLALLQNAYLGIGTEGALLSPNLYTGMMVLGTLVFIVGNAIFCGPLKYLPGEVPAHARSARAGSSQALLGSGEALLLGVPAWGVAATGIAITLLFLGAEFYSARHDRKKAIRADAATRLPARGELARCLYDPTLELAKVYGQRKNLPAFKIFLTATFPQELRRTMAPLEQRRDELNRRIEQLGALKTQHEADPSQLGELYETKMRDLNDAIATTTDELAILQRDRLAPINAEIAKFETLGDAVDALAVRYGYEDAAVVIDLAIAETAASVATAQDVGEVVHAEVQSLLGQAAEISAAVGVLLGAQSDDLSAESANAVTARLLSAAPIVD